MAQVLKQSLVAMAKSVPIFTQRAFAHSARGKSGSKANIDGANDSVLVWRPLTQVDHNEHAMRLDTFLQRRMKMPINIVRLKILNKEVIVTGSAHARSVELKPQGILHAGDTVQVCTTRSTSETSGKKGDGVKRMSQKEQKMIEKIRNSILYRDSDLLCINKPPDLSVQGGSKQRLELDALLPAFQFDAEEPPRLVHRLDKDTTGVLVLARTKVAATRLANIFSGVAKSPIDKEYLAMLCEPISTPDSAASDGSWIIESGIVMRGPQGREKMTIRRVEEVDDRYPDQNPRGIKRATTIVNCIDANPVGSIVSLCPVTGRKHQLRVHCAQILKAPILGDYKFGAGCSPSNKQLFGNSSDTIPMHLHLRRLVLRNWFSPNGGDLEVIAPMPSHFARTAKLMKLSLPPTKVR
ncbi:pseudouridine synthase [Cladochytrium replicatum]|nr:pseudouridine synthase [Cladochytrium replicatum]